MYLNAAEAAWHLGQYDDARQYTADIYAARYSDGGSAKTAALEAMADDAVLGEILDERARELASKAIAGLICGAMASRVWSVLTEAKRMCSSRAMRVTPYASRPRQSLPIRDLRINCFPMRIFDSRTRLLSRPYFQTILIKKQPI